MPAGTAQWRWHGQDGIGCTQERGGAGMRGSMGAFVVFSPEHRWAVLHALRWGSARGQWGRV